MIVITDAKLKKYIKDPDKHHIPLTWASTDPNDNTIVMSGKTLRNIIEQNLYVTYSGPMGLHGSLINGIWIDLSDRTTTLLMDELTIEPTKCYMIGFHLGYDCPKLCLTETRIISRRR